MARGRKSQASLTVAAVTELKQIPEPLEQLTPEQGEIWRLVMVSSAGNFIQSESYPVLAEFCRAVIVGGQIAQELDRYTVEWLEEDDGLRRWDKLQAMQDRTSRRIASLAVKLRLPQSTRMHPKSAGAAERNSSKRKPWQFKG